ncbi:hypothetical protein MJO29_007038, partial [Puccinia striiformis f. sp. tritici]
FNHLRADHKVEAFVPIVSSDAAGSVFPHGGTPLGQMYMDILKAKYECWKKFHIWVTGMTVDAELNPMARPFKNLPQRAIAPWEAGDVSQRKTSSQFNLTTLTPRKQTVDLETTLLNQDTSEYLKEKIHVVLKAFHFNGILLSSAIGKGKADSSEVCGPQQLTNSSKANTPDDTGNAGSAHLVA